MKRILLSVLAAAATVAMTVPASAADFTFSGEYKLKGEYRDNADFNKDATDNTSYIDHRARVTANAKATDDVSVKITLQDTRRWGTNTGAQDSGPALTDAASGNTIDLHESYVNIDNLFGAPVALRIGRQELAYGDQRLVGAFNWSMNARAFDAFKLTYNSDIANVDLFASKVKENTTSDNDQDFYGAYATIKAIPNNTIDVYGFLLRDGSTTAMLASNTAYTSDGSVQKLYTVGARIKGAALGLDYTLEAPFQSGEVKDATTTYDIGGYAFAAKVGYTIPGPLKIRVGAEYDYASGDDNASDDKLETFFNLFPTNHDKLGFMDQQAWRNVSAWNVNAQVDLNEKIGVYASWWNFKLAEKQDGWYGAATWNKAASGTLRAASSTRDSDEIGNELDLVATYKYNSALTAELGYGHFFAGKAIEDAITNEEDQDWAYLQVVTKF